jgi:hypothetical protein
MSSFSEIYLACAGGISRRRRWLQKRLQEIDVICAVITEYLTL